jgi:Integrase zinc binding domain
VEGAARFLRWGPDTLQIKRGDDWVDIPPVAVRSEIVEERHILLRHAGVSKLMASLRNDFYWSHMLEDVTKVVKECDSC